MIRLFTTIILSCWLFNTVAQQRFEAENATLSGDAVIETTEQGFSGSGYVTIKNDGNLSFTIPVETAGFYNILIGYHAVFGDKKQHLKVNGQTVGEVSFPQAETFGEVEGARKIRLNAGDNTIEIINSWGWMLIDYIEITGFVDTPFRIDSELVTPDPSQEAKAVYDFLKENFGKKVISGVMTLNSMVEPEWLYQQTGKYPALLGLDFMHNVGKGTEWFVNDPNRIHQVATDAENYFNRNGLPAVCWHWRDPLKITDAFYTENTTFDVSKVTDTNSAEYRAMISDIDVIAAELKLLQDKNIPVLWRPLHEAAGGWFWWGAKGAEPCKALWNLLFERLTEHHGLHNLIWVWTADANDAALDWYPGDDVVDIVGIDIYPDAGDHNSQVAAFEKLKDVFQGRKILALSECGSIPDPDEMVSDGATWSYFMPWYGDHTIPSGNNPHNTVEFWRKIMAHESVLTLDEMPTFRTNVGIPAMATKASHVNISASHAQGTVTVQSNENIQQIRVMNINGSLIEEIKKEGHAINLNSSSWKKGVYLLVIKTDSGESIHKMIK